ncbi:toll-like receptor 4 [Aplysia californica]|uniref:Toll-like receptor 4 n=1 Tax=Aplysia californica TaxID=6500 RepID=A0ABM1VRG6_APLCA|nr:toll-like receptor 4 [Aplysia californica]
MYIIYCRSVSMVVPLVHRLLTADVPVFRVWFLLTLVHVTWSAVLTTSSLPPVVSVSSVCQDTPTTDTSSLCTEFVVSQSDCVEIDCKGKGIVQLEASWFPCNACKLDLQYNALEIIHNTSFARLSRLRWLSMRFNRIRKIKPFAFDNLVSLEYLNLEFNYLELSAASYPSHLFSPLTQLKTLRLAHQNSQALDSYPPDFIFNMTSLRALSVTTVGQVLHFGPEFCQLQNLSRLEISGPVRQITNSSFEGLECLTLIELSLNKLPSLTIFELDALKPINRGLRSLHISHVYVGVQKILQILNPLKGCDMYEIYFEHVGLYTKMTGFSVLTGDGIINGNSAEYLKDICVKRLSLLKSHIFLLDSFVFQGGRIVKCLKYLDVSGNTILGSFAALFYTLKIPTLEIFAIINKSRHYIHSDLEKTILERNTPLESPIPPEQVCSKGDNHPSPHQAKQDNPMMMLSHTRKQRGAMTMFYVSRNLKALIFHLEHGKTHFAGETTIMHADKLEVLICRDNGFNSFTGHLYGVDHIKVIDLSYNDFSNTAFSFTENFTGIETLVLSHVNFNTHFMSKESHSVFHSMSYLKSLDLSSNSLAELSVGTFRENDKLESLNLANNKFRSVPFDLSLTPQLRHLDLSKNAIFQLSIKQCHELDLHSGKITDFRLVLKDNMLSCSCDSISFLWWLGHTTALLDDGGNYTCITAPGQLSYTSAYTDTRALWRKCFGKMFLWLSLVLLAVMIIGFLAVVLISRHSNYLRAALFKIIDQTFRLKTLEDYPIGVFVGYAEKDYRFPCLQLLPYLEDLHLTVYVRDRDMLPHENVATAIMEAIKNSWRVVLVITEAFLSYDKWSEFTMRSAVYSQCPQNPAKVVLVVEERLRNRLPTQLVAGVGDENVLCLERLVMCYELTQGLKTLTLQN